MSTLLLFDKIHLLVIQTGLAFVDVLTSFGFFMIKALPFVLFGRCFQLLFFDKRKKYHWTKLEQNPKKYCTHLAEDQNIKTFLKYFLWYFGVAMFCMAMVKSFSIITPSQEGTHFLDMWTKQNIKEILGVYSTIIILVTAVKISQYRMYGIINSYDDFKLKMIFWM